MNRDLRNIIIEHNDAIIQNWSKEINKLKEQNYTSDISDELYEHNNQEFVNVIIHSIKGTGSTKLVKDFSDRIIQLGWPLSYITDGLLVFRRVATNIILKQVDHVDSNTANEVLRNIDSLVEPIIRQLVNEYSVSWEHVVSLQRIALQELSAPLIPVMDNITIMPLIGTIDTERAKFIMENLLDGVMRHNAEVVLIDITGVPVVDTMVAHHLFQATEAVRLLGAKCILVGIRPEIAQTIVNLGINFSNLPTKSTLKKGFMLALEITNKSIVEMNNKSQTLDELLGKSTGSEEDHENTDLKTT
ncbi:RsbT co-antagonist protein RsbRA [Ornithinibacillus halotolerans]|uniref:RsbT co-antagonist protein RsbRA n=1 Tax=Ornithinibacillus halotolerans TaxID=1274357 RepID=A0A916SBQ6_9BACI|nr:RsbT co-antagonist protein RsbRA [Ornithinibacillus halotolerans]GGA92661.1 RsbT co-antagonist protein RsbRA [Ornithinibacillus halotolerans]